MLLFYLSLVDTDEDRSKVARIYKRYYGLMTYVAEQMLGDKKDAAPDIVHDSILKIIDRIGTLDLSDAEKTKNLCLTIVRNKCIDYLRRKDTNTLPLDDCPDEDCGDAAPDDIVVSEETVDAVFRAIGSLGEKYIDVCVMKFVYGYRDGEIAGLLGLVPETVRSRICYARKKLAEILRGGGTIE